MGIFHHLLSHPLTRGLDLDDPRTTLLRRQIIQSKPFLRRIYEDWYTFVASSLPDVSGQVLELGSGAGFLDQFVPGLITSDVFPTPGLGLVLDAQNLPFADRSLRGIVLIDVLHHLSDSPRFFDSASRCLVPGGRIIMVEPWVTAWSAFVYRRLHHEPFVPDAADWTFPRTGPVSGANIALPWILFHRDRERFETRFPALKIRSLCPILPFGYLVSGGVSMRTLAPGWSFGSWKFVENFLRPWMHRWGMFAQIIVERGDI